MFQVRPWARMFQVRPWSKKLTQKPSPTGKTALALYNGSSRVRVGELLIKEPAATASS